MEEFTNFFIICTIIYIVYVYLKSSQYEVKYIKSTVNNSTYLVRNLPDKQKASDLLGEIVKRIEKLRNYLEVKFPKDNRIERFVKKFNADNISEGTPDNKYTSYSVNKGEKIVFCIRSRDEKEELEGINTMMFVALHEVAHIITISVGHTDEFWKNFRFLLKHAIDIGIYKKVNYNKSPVDYCGMKITDSPL